MEVTGEKIEVTSESRDSMQRKTTRDSPMDHTVVNGLKDDSCYLEVIILYNFCTVCPCGSSCRDPSETKLINSYSYVKGDVTIGNILLTKYLSFVVSYYNHFKLSCSLH